MVYDVYVFTTEYGYKLFTRYLASHIKFTPKLIGQGVLCDFYQILCILHFLERSDIRRLRCCNSHLVEAAIVNSKSRWIGLPTVLIRNPISL